MKNEKNLQKIIESHLSSEIQRFCSNVTYHTVNKIVDTFKDQENQLIKIESVSMDQDDDGLISIKIALRKAF